MMKYELCICIKDEANLASGHRRKKEGDIIVIKPYLCETGFLTMRDHLIVVVDTSETFDEMFKYMMPYFEDGYDVYPDELVGDRPKILEKRRFKIPLDILRDGWYPQLDLDKVHDSSYFYQPFKKESDLIAPFDGKEGKYLLNIGDVDCGLSASTEIVVDMTEPVSFMWDKDKASYKYSKKKVI